MLKVLVLSLMLFSHSAFSQLQDDIYINNDVFAWLGSSTGSFVAWGYKNVRCNDPSDYWNYGHKQDNIITVNRIDPDFDNLQTICSDYKNESVPGAVDSCDAQTCALYTSFHPSSLGDKYLQFDHDVIGTTGVNAVPPGAQVFALR